MNDIFISYASADRPRVKPLVDALQQKGWSVWWDRTIRAGRTFDRVIEAALKDARCVVVLWSQTSIESDWVRTEADEAKRRGILVPALIDDVEIPLAFRRIQAANLVGWSGALPSAQFDELALAVSEVLSSSASSAPDAKKAAEEKARLEQEERERKAAEEKAQQQKLKNKRQAAAEQARLQEERRLAAEKAQLEEQERQRKAAKQKARPFLSKKMIIGLGVGAVVLLLVWILWPRRPSNHALQPQTAEQQPQTTVPQTQPATPAQQPQDRGQPPQKTERQSVEQQPLSKGAKPQPQTAVQQPQTQPQTAVQQPQPRSAEANVKKPVAENCPEGVYCDPDTNLMWTIQDNGKDIIWPEADQYCRSLNLAGLSDWELPTIDELAKLYDPKNSSQHKIRKPLRLTGDWVWSSTKEASGSALNFLFDLGRRGVSTMVYFHNHRALCVRQSTGQQPQQQTTVPQTQPQSSGQQSQTPAADVKKPVANNCPEGVYCDPDTNLMWTIQDNGKDIAWPGADKYCKSLTLAGLSGWELPTIGELEKLYDPRSSNKIRKPFRLTLCCSWSSTTKEGSGYAWYFSFYGGKRYNFPMGASGRALCVRRSGE